MTNTTTTTNTIEVNVEMKMKDLRAIGKGFGVKAPVGTTKETLVANIIAAQKQLQTTEEEMVVMETAKTIVEETVATTTNNTKNEMEMVEMTKTNNEVKANEVVLPAEVLEANQRALDNSKGNALDVTQRNPHTFFTGHTNHVQSGVMQYINEGARRFMEHQEKMNLEVTDFMFVNNAKADAFGRKVIGVLQVRVGAGVMVVKQWEQTPEALAAGKRGEFVWKAFENHTYTKAAPTAQGIRVYKTDVFAPLMEGEGILTLPIYENKEGLAHVSLPVTRAEKEGKVTFYEVFRSRRAGAEFFSARTNEVINALLTASARLLRAQFVEANPLNRGGIKESCLNCRFIKYFPIKDGVTDDLETDKGSLVDTTKEIQSGKAGIDYSSARWMQQLSTDELTGNGSNLPQHFCPVVGQYVGKKAVMDFKKLSEAESNQVELEEGVFTYVPAGKVVVSGRVMDYNEYLENELENVASDCNYYHMNEPKGAHVVAAEKVEAREERGTDANGNYAEKVYVSPNYVTNAKPERMPVQMRVNGVWVNAFPGQVDNADAIRIYGLEGYKMMFSEKAMDRFAAYGFNYVPTKEAVDAEKFNFNVVLRGSYNTLMNNNASEEDVAEIESYVKETPAHIVEMFKKRADGAQLQERWNKMVSFFERQQGWKTVETRADFKVKFFTENAEGRKVLDSEAGDFSPAALLYDFKWNEENENVLHTPGGTVIDYKGGSVTINENGEEKEVVYSGITGKEFVRNIDSEKGDRLVEYVLTTGNDVVFATDEAENITEEDVRLLAEAMQILVQREMNKYVWAVRKEEEGERKAKINFLSDEAKLYIIENL